MFITLELPNTQLGSIQINKSLITTVRVVKETTTRYHIEINLNNGQVYVYTKDGITNYTSEADAISALSAFTQSL